MIPWQTRNSGVRLPDDVRPRPEPAKPEPDPKPKPKVETLYTDSPHSPPGYERTEEPAVMIDYGRGPRYRWPHRKVPDG